MPDNSGAAAAGAAGVGAVPASGYTPGGGAGAGGDGGSRGRSRGRGGHGGEAQSGIVRLTPAESHDYWLLPDQQLGLTDMWRPDGSWEDPTRLNGSDGGMTGEVAPHMRLKPRHTPATSPAFTDPLQRTGGAFTLQSTPRHASHLPSTH
ncbi:hypothetical protein CLOM_g18435 [Closterium sp. NIES-68]|nr:hypothetical protein CLOM_g18435 [Closterium sp. NIES-68]